MDDTQHSPDSTPLTGVAWAEAVYRFTIEAARRHQAQGAKRVLPGGMSDHDAPERIRNEAERREVERRVAERRQVEHREVGPAPWEDLIDAAEEETSTLPAPTVPVAVMEGTKRAKSEDDTEKKNAKAPTKRSKTEDHTGVKYDSGHEDERDSKDRAKDDASDEKKDW